MLEVRHSAGSIIAGPVVSGAGACLLWMLIRSRHVDAKYWRRRGGTPGKSEKAGSPTGLTRLCSLFRRGPVVGNQLPQTTS